MTDEIVFPRLSLLSPGGCTAVVCLHGAHVTSFKPRDGKEVLFVSSEAIYEAPKAIRGGIPVCWPQFSDMGPGTPHGFARNSGFIVSDWSEKSVSFSLPPAAVTNSSLPPGWELFVDISINDEHGGQLTQQLRVRNTGTETLKTTQALHTYLSVSGIEAVSVKGLEGCAYHDNLDDRALKPGAEEPVTFDKEVDRIYAATGSKIQVEDAGWSRRIVVEKEGFADAVVWNPWIDKAKSLKDFGDEEYKNMVCVEAANAAMYLKGESIEIKPGESWAATQHIYTETLDC